MKVTLAQLNYIIGQFEYNYKKIIESIEKNHNQTDIIVFSELALSGYYMFDLLDDKSFFQKQNKFLNQLIEQSKNYHCAIIIGAILENKNKGKPFFNGALVIYQGEVIYQYHKHLLPSYNIFNEPRHFQKGKTKPYFQFKDKTIGLLICEDLWDQDKTQYEKTPLDALTEINKSDHKLDFILTLNSSPSEYEKQLRRFQLVSQLAKNTQSPVLYINQIGGYDEIVYDGASFVTNKNGELVDFLPSFKEEAKTINLNHLETKSYQFLDKNALTLEQLKLGLRDYVHKCGFKDVVVSLSGGIDSALTLVLATLALGKENVTAITMPSTYSSKGSVTDSEVLCQNLGVTLFNRDIKEDYELSVKAFEASFKQNPSRLTKENMQARIRGRVVMEYSNEFGLLAISCGNKSELSVGYATLYGDMNGGINIIGDLYKTEVYELSNYINEKYNLIPKNIITKAPSAELSEGQKDSDSLPEYELLDAMLKLSIEGDLLEKNEIKQLKKIISKLNQNEIIRILKLIDRAEFKRKQAPPIIRIQKRSFGFGRVVPIAHQFMRDHWQIEG